MGRTVSQVTHMHGNHAVQQCDNATVQTWCGVVEGEGEGRGSGVGQQVVEP
jgi:hypothetical protein